jgi:tetratricopeptide (TPR) repeat protein
LNKEPGRQALLKREKLNPTGPVIVLVVVNLLLYWRTIHFDFLGFDDTVHLFQNPALKSASLESLARIWRAPYYELYIPVTYSFWFFIALMGSLADGSAPALHFNPSFFHGANILLHIFNSLLCFQLNRMLLARILGNAPDNPGRLDRISLAGALFFSVHPLQVEGVAWISGAKDLLSTFFALGSILLYLKSFPEEKLRNGKFRALTYLSSIATFALSVLAKPSALALPCVLLATDFFFINPLRPEANPEAMKNKFAKALFNILPFALPFAVLAFLALIPLLKLQPDSAISYVAAWKDRPLIAIDALLFYAGKILVPYPLSADYGRSPLNLLAQPMVFKICSGLVFAGMALWISRLKRKGFPLAILFVLSLIPTLGLVPFRYQDISTVADRYTYFAMSFAAVAFACTFATFSKSIRWISALCLLVFFALSLNGTAQWKSDRTLVEDVLAKNDRSFIFLARRGDLLHEQGDLEGALTWYRRSVSVNPHFVPSQINLAITLFKLRQVDEAVAIYRSLVAYFPEDQKLREDLRIILRSTGK